MHGDDTHQGSVEQDAGARLLVGQQLVFRLIVLEILQAFASAYDSFLHGLTCLGRVGQAERGELFQLGVKGLNTQEIAHVPDLDHARGISSYDLRGFRQALHPY